MKQIYVGRVGASERSEARGPGKEKPAASSAQNDRPSGRDFTRTAADKIVHEHATALKWLKDK